jgi:protein TonB
MHVAIAAALTSWASRVAHEEATSQASQNPLTNLVWFERPGDTGDVGVGGNHEIGPAQSAKRPGTSSITMPSRVAPSSVNDHERTPPLQEISVPVLPSAADLIEVPGVVSTFAVIDQGTSYGPRTGPGSGTKGRGPGDSDPGTIGVGPGGPGSGVHPPELIAQVRPQYTTAAMMARIQGVVGMEAMVLPDGSVGDVRVTRSLDQNLGLDQEAITAVTRWRFRPATRQGTAIAMFVSIEMTFSLR